MTVSASFTVDKDAD